MDGFPQNFLLVFRASSRSMNPPKQKQGRPSEALVCCLRVIVSGLELASLMRELGNMLTPVSRLLPRRAILCWKLFSFTRPKRSRPCLRGLERFTPSACSWGLSNRYEHLDRDVLWGRAEASESRWELIAVIISQYQSRCFVIFQSTYMFAGYAHFGLPAGCSYASYFMRVYTLASLEEI